tara:strand:+ start:11855 stop:12418 length:564 start_codon:yes stop_codon:yes gene_type:complete
MASDEVIKFLESRRSASASFLTSPAPTKSELKTILKMGLRSPDHGRLEPWRIIVLSPNALKEIAFHVSSVGLKNKVDPDKLEKSKNRFLNSPLVLVVISSLRESKIPAPEQILSAGAVCMSILNAALANGWGACWLTGWTAHDEEFKKTALNLSENETIAGYIHIGTNTKMLEDRDRPDLSKVVEWR